MFMFVYVLFITRNENFVSHIQYSNVTRSPGDSEVNGFTRIWMFFFLLRSHRGIFLKYLADNISIWKHFSHLLGGNGFNERCSGLRPMRSQVTRLKLLNFGKDFFAEID